MRMDTLWREKNYIQRNYFKGKYRCFSFTERYFHIVKIWLSTKKKKKEGYHTYPFISIGKNKKNIKYIWLFLERKH